MNVVLCIGTFLMSVLAFIIIFDGIYKLCHTKKEIWMMFLYLGEILIGTFFIFLSSI